MRLRFADDDLRRLYEEDGFRLPRIGPDVTTSYRRKVRYLEASDSELAVRSMASLHLENETGEG